MSAATMSQPQADTLAQTNRKYWDVASKDTNRAQWVNDLQDLIGSFLIDPNSSFWLGLPPQGHHLTKMLDYACGDGLPSRSLKPHFKQCIGVDVSAGMLAKYNATANRLGLGPEEMLGVRGDLFADPMEPTDPPLPEEKLQNFDLVAICMALHHMEDIQAAVSKLAARLRPGGTLLVIDWARIDGATVAQREFMEHVKKSNPPPAGQPHAAHHTISHDSFTEEKIAELFHNAGCSDVRWKLADSLSDVPGARTGKMQLFWARATKGEGKQAPHGSL